MKKSCKKCKALTLNGCSLGYKTDFKSYLHSKFYYPLEDCPKPLTNEDYITLSKVRS